MSKALRTCLCAAFLCITSEVAFGQDTRIFPARGGQPYVIKPQGGNLPLYGRSAALIVSESRYLGGTSGWRVLSETAPEMDKVKDALVNQGFEVTRVYDPTSNSLYAEMQNFLGKYGRYEDARLVFFYSGHGYTNAVNQMSYIVPIDTGNPSTDYQSFISRAVTLESFHTWVRQFNASHFLAIFDSCFSGAIFTTKSLTDVPEQRPLIVDNRWRYLADMAKKPVRQFISAGGAGEELPAKSSFVPVFIEGIGGGASGTKDGYVTGKELGVFIEQIVNTKRGGHQHPVSGVSNDASFIFGDMIFQYDSSRAGLSVTAAPLIVRESDEAQKSSQEGKLSKPKPSAPLATASPNQQSQGVSDECKIFDCSRK